MIVEQPVKTSLVKVKICFILGEAKITKNKPNNNSGIKPSLPNQIKIENHLSSPLNLQTNLNRIGKLKASLTLNKCCNLKFPSSHP